jgi:uncharacterized protein (TIGR03435 family)
MVRHCRQVPEGATKEQFRLMQQNLLAERFKLAVHREKKEMPIYELVVANGGMKLREASAGEPKNETELPRSPGVMKTDYEGFPIPPPGQTGYAIVRGHARPWGSGETMEHFASTLAGQLGGPVIDATGLRGKYDFTLSWLVADTTPALLSALPEQLGLTLRRTRGQVEALVVDHVEKTPIGN